MTLVRALGDTSVVDDQDVAELLRRQPTARVVLRSPAPATRSRVTPPLELARIPSRVTP